VVRNGGVVFEKDSEVEEVFGHIRGGDGFGGFIAFDFIGSGLHKGIITWTSVF